MPAPSSFKEFQPASTTDQAFNVIHTAIITLELPPGTKISEAEVAKNLGISRQPVRDAFYRLSEMGFLRIRPQRATRVSYISEQSLLDARFIRTAIELECMRAALDRITSEDFDELELSLERQQAAIDAGERLKFHELDDGFHRTISEIAGHPRAWSLIRDQKVHLDRVRYMSLTSGAQSALDEHHQILGFMRAGDWEQTEAHLRLHLSSILKILGQVRTTHSHFFEDS
jgi:DNA-binding GntR family transcriptional regulator